MTKKGKIVLLFMLSILLVSAPTRVSASSTSILLYIEEEQKEDTVKDSPETEKETSVAKITAVKTGDTQQTAGLIAVSLAAGAVIYLLLLFRGKGQNTGKKE